VREEFQGVERKRRVGSFRCIECHKRKLDMFVRPVARQLPRSRILALSCRASTETISLNLLKHAITACTLPAASGVRVKLSVTISTELCYCIPPVLVGTWRETRSSRTRQAPKTSSPRPNCYSKYNASLKTHQR